MWLPLILKLAPVIIDFLVKAGFFTALEGEAAHAFVFVKKMKTYPEYPNAPPSETNQHNFTVGEKPK